MIKKGLKKNTKEKKLPLKPPLIMEMRSINRVNIKHCNNTINFLHKAPKLSKYHAGKKVLIKALNSKILRCMLSLDSVLLCKSH